LLHDILEAAAKNANAKNGSNEQAGDYYASCMDESKIEAEGLKPLAAELERITRIKDQKTLQEEITHLHFIGINAAFGDGQNQISRREQFRNDRGVFQGGLACQTATTTRRPMRSRKRSVSSM
jgi:predicted metalloendopeptidase